ncbi:MAG: OmpA family protein [Ignavibacteriaceae bacterium]|nr:OmpA family protein [Ignavibacteriaceae bacterium]
MLKNLTFFIVFAAALITDVYAQVPTDSWGFGFGVGYPRFIGSEATSREINYGGFLSIQRDFSEHVSLRLKPAYSRIEGNTPKVGVDLMQVAADILFNFNPRLNISPYIGLGFSATYQDVKNTVNPNTTLDYQSNIYLGAYYRNALGKDWGLKAEVGIHTLGNDQLDGITGPLSGLLGGGRDSYLNFEFGLIKTFGKGPESKLFSLYPGVTGSGDSKEPEKKRAHSLVTAYKTSWQMGIGALLPRFTGTDIVSPEESYGGYIHFTRYFSEYVGLRIKPYYAYFTLKKKPETTFIGSNLDLIYKFVPCEPVSPYVGLGGGFYYMDVKNGTSFKDKSWIDYQFNLTMGAQWNLFSDNWSIATEVMYHTLANDNADGLIGPVGGMFGGPHDAYISFNMGINFYLKKGEKSDECTIYDGLAVKYIEKEKQPDQPSGKDTVKIVDGKVYEPIDYSKIEEIVKKYRQDPVDYKKIEQIVKENAGKGSANWVLMNINFDFASATIRSESYPILYNAAQILIDNPKMTVEIQGHTDNVGGSESNVDLSLKRAEAVRNFLISKGVAGTRLTAKGYGATLPVGDNATAEGRAMNRRVEFKVLSK